MIEVSIIEQVESFYSSAWDKLILSGVLVFLLLAIVLPLVFYAFNFRMMKTKLNQKFHLLKLETVVELRLQIEMVEPAEFGKKL